MRLVFAVFRLPFWVFLAAAGGIFYLGELAHRDTLAQNQEMTRALAGNPPETVDLADFSRTMNTGPADEISVRGIINPDYNYELTKRRKGADKTRYMFVLFDAADPADSKMARGALVLTEDEKDKFVNEYYFENSAIAFAETGAVSVIALNGQDEGSPDLSSMVRDAFEEQNLTKSENFIYIEPFLDGREAGLTPTMSANELRDIIRGVGLVAALIGLVKFARRRRKKAARSDEGYEEVPATSDAGAQFVQTVPVGGHGTDPAADTGAARDGAATRDGAAAPKRRLPFKTLAVVALIAVALYSGNFAYLSIALFIAAYVFIIRKTHKAISGGLNRLGVTLPGSKSDAAILAQFQKDAGAGAEIGAMAAEGDVRENGTGLSPSIHKKDLVEDSKEPVGTEASLTRGRFKLPFVNRKRSAAPESAIEGNKDDETGHKGLGLPLPGLNRAEEATPAASAPRAPVRRSKEAFQAPVLFDSGDTDESRSIGGKLQLLLARLKPAEGAPRALAGRPDPFEKLASESRGNTAR
ncbi:hypothetical protein [Roseovarius aestuarii]|uniref:Uncharacterized protein n=1 Tax=Roseovarius aestuarii TaxID=475083 RepID=A0A1X7BRS7_9RHOB|nr:hypothetical protein [Roseovarius aestuarii]SMC12331.1 hypothetical protein ROA7745_02155 [Roseovarius aestuarii]